jgi:hypothetical protein
MKKAIRKKLAKKRASPKKKLAKKKVAPRSVKVKTNKEQVRRKSQSVDTVPLALERLGGRSGEQSGDLQGVSHIPGADSESVDELLEEGNAFEAEAVKGVEDAEDADGGEVRTHQAPEDDVPGEYQNGE